jgi:hypothetical protein
MIKPYADVIYADNYLAGRGNEDKWQELTMTEKERYLFSATLKIDTLKFNGKKTNPRQNREFPRNGGKYIPDDVKCACADEAYSMLNDANVQRRELIRAGVTSFSIGDLHETYGGAGVDDILLSQTAKILLSKYLGGGFVVG